MDELIISKLGLDPQALQGETVVVTGAGGGIGYEACRALLWLGANVIVAEIKQVNGSRAAEKLGQEFDPARVAFVHTDVGDEASVQALQAEAGRRFGKVDAVLNNATIAKLGLVTEAPIAQWDESYRVNLRGPVLLARAFLPGMIERNHGVFACVSSTGSAYMGSYESIKAAQVHLGNTLDAELEGKGVFAYTIGPGLVPTETATTAIQQLAPMLGMDLDTFYTMNKNAMLTPEEAGAGFAVSILFAEKFKGMEISSMQALKAADINFGGPGEAESASPVERQAATQACRQVIKTLREQSEGWKQRSIFERQWVLRDFKKTSGMPAEEWLEKLGQLERELETGGNVRHLELEKLAGYYDHMAELAKGYEKNAAKLEENLRYVYGWRDEVKALISTLN